MNLKKPTAILTGDWHLREDQPVCRTDNFWEAQWRKVDFISDLQRAFDCPVLHSGDLFHTAKPSLYLVNVAMGHLPSRFFTVYGNHDLPQHNLELAEKCGIRLLEKAGCLTVLPGIHWGQVPFSWPYSLVQFPRLIEKQFIVWHVMTFADEEPWPGCPDPNALRILKKYPEFDLILTGHNHQTFTVGLKNRILVNPGSITRQEADQANHEPCVFLWDASDNTVEKVLIPFSEGIITREHIDRIKRRDDRLDAFVSRLNNEWEASVSFEENLDRLIKANNIRQSVVQIINNAVL